MREVLDQAVAWYGQGVRFAQATVVRTWHSAPRPPGATMLVAETGEVAGSISGGCVEGAVYELAREVLETGRPVTETYGVSDGDALAVGLTCGGILEVFVRPVESGQDPAVEDIAHAMEAGRPLAVATTLADGHLPAGARLVVGPTGVRGSLGDVRLDSSAAECVREMLRRGETGVLRSVAGPGCSWAVPVFVESYAPAPRMLVFGAIDFAEAVTRIGKFLGYHVTLCDARPVFATSARFPQADEIVVDWPHRYLAAQRERIDERTVICVLTHDPKFDIPLLEVALRTDAGYVGAMGSRRTHEGRLERLRQVGVGQAELGRLSSPIGLDLGARSPEETAVSVAAEIIAAHWGGTGKRLSGTRVPIHHRTPREPLPGRPPDPVRDTG
ncbi:XdhC family protein [Streptomyces sp. SID10853]|uniref:XdhC family protein n=1 Tax=Streptomyces sp. SID10853 TaxID=2706028 RepID=UPI0013C1F7D0|nr:XdhC/CoxI family protein [Streptomyces sp. SID10853]NDZ78273.1 XdhC family protein [Streptomyces sp. SID10853]